MRIWIAFCCSHLVMSGFVPELTLIRWHDPGGPNPVNLFADSSMSSRSHAESTPHLLRGAWV